VKAWHWGKRQFWLERAFSRDSAGGRGLLKGALGHRVPGQEILHMHLLRHEASVHRHVAFVRMLGHAAFAHALKVRPVLLLARRGAVWPALASVAAAAW